MKFDVGKTSLNPFRSADSIDGIFFMFFLLHSFSRTCMDGHKSLSNRILFFQSQAATISFMNLLKVHTHKYIRMKGERKENGLEEEKRIFFGGERKKKQLHKCKKKEERPGWHSTCKKKVFVSWE